jgi:uncharacterized surface protein with fasciclin (FAS1) repeats
MKFRITRNCASILVSVAFLCLLAIIPAKANDPTRNITEIATTGSNFSILHKALEATGLDKTLKEGKYTIFAPTDEAFNRLPAGMLDNLMKDKEALKNILLYHVVPGKLKAEEVSNRTELQTIQGNKAFIKKKEGKTKINKARILQPDIVATNGVIHIIDAVITPQDMTIKPDK